MPGKNAIVSPAPRAFGRLKVISCFAQAAVSAYRVGDSLEDISKCQAGRDAAFLRRKPQQGRYYGFPQSIHHWWCRKANVEPMACSSCDTHGLMSAVAWSREGGRIFSLGFEMQPRSPGYSPLHPTASKAVVYYQQKLFQVTEAQLKISGGPRKQNSTHQALKTSGPNTEYDSHPTTWSSIFVSTRLIASFCYMWERQSTDPPAEHQLPS
ncbi:hypothetical protein M436DRAFT_61032 [Aureobasidium namibiae CBS 147.97]|uniref:Uncharacterized protein n=1 Tax=Aureobasidium namibiae CBS 147.97 TaxID=1043004 RepID=A0A074X5C6_9PEZI|nr:uncharacterized protein M436DRAFT_61032 [Aureobasidium namibiae CBS 147.97]KEQ77272.1 hypothetical protein M436DRAFT_61032 [Aureobasidium namibiae CBS 147.97]